MNPYRPFHHRFLAKRQGLNGVFGGLIPGGPIQSASAQGSSMPSESSTGSGGIIGGVTSIVGGITTDIVASSATSPAPSTSLTHSSSSTGSTTTPSSTSTPSASSTTSSTSPPATHTTQPTSASGIVYASSDGTSIVYVTSTLPAASATGTSHRSFLQNPSLEGGVFTLVGFATLIIVFVLTTWIIRKRRRARLERDLAAAVSFDPGVTGLYERQEDPIEKRRPSGSSSGHGHGYIHGYGSPQTAYVPQQEYHGLQGYGQFPAVAYSPSPPNPVSYKLPSPTVPQPLAQGGANLTRKFSDRKPVPPLLPDPANDPANTRVSVPPQFYQQ